MSSQFTNLQTRSRSTAVHNRNKDHHAQWSAQRPYVEEDKLGRIPSWSDRVIYSNTGDNRHKIRVKLNDYNSIKHYELPCVGSSDHDPIYQDVTVSLGNTNLRIFIVSWNVEECTKYISDPSFAQFVVKKMDPKTDVFFVAVQEGDSNEINISHFNASLMTIHPSVAHGLPRTGRRRAQHAPEPIWEFYGRKHMGLTTGTRKRISGLLWRKRTNINVCGNWITKALNIGHTKGYVCTPIISKGIGNEIIHFRLISAHLPFTASEGGIIKSNYNDMLEKRQLKLNEIWNYRTNGGKEDVMLFLAGDLNFRQHPEDSFKPKHFERGIIDELTQFISDEKYGPTQEQKWMELTTNSIGPDLNNFYPTCKLQKTFG